MHEYRHHSYHVSGLTSASGVSETYVCFVYLIWVDSAFHADRPRLFPQLTHQARLRYDRAEERFRPLSDVRSILPFDVYSHSDMFEYCVPSPRPLHQPRFPHVFERDESDRSYLAEAAQDNRRRL